MRICECCQHVEVVYQYPSGTETDCWECDCLLMAARKAITQARSIGVPKYGPDTWRQATDNIEHATTHIYKHRRGDTTEDHLAHAICRLVMEYAKHESN